MSKIEYYGSKCPTGIKTRKINNKIGGNRDDMVKSARAKVCTLKPTIITLFQNQ